MDSIKQATHVASYCFTEQMASDILHNEEIKRPTTASPVIVWTCSGFAVRHCFLFFPIVGCLLSCWQHGTAVRSTSISLGPGTLPCRLLCSTLLRCDLHNLHLYLWTRWKSSITMRNLKFSMCYLHCDACVSMFAVGAGSGECRAMQGFLLSPLQAAPQTEATAGQTHWTMGPSQVSTLV